MKSEECSKYIATLTIAGSDCSGGAGIQADIKTMSALGCYAASAITAITVQNTLGVTAVHAVPPEIVAGQIKAVMDDIEPKAIKIGMVNDAETIFAIAETLKAYSLPQLVVDPVMVSTSGSRLMQDDALDVFCRELLPLATLLTPNVPEAEVLSGIKITDKGSMDKAARRVLQLGCNNILIKGGHLAGQKVDRLYGDVDCEYVAENVVTRNTHGTGCSLSSAITTFLAQGFSTDEAIGKAKEWLTEALKAGADVEIGHGHGPVNHFFNPKSLFTLKKQ